MKEEIQSEIKDITEMIRRFIAVNKNDVAFVGSFVAFDEKEEVKDNTGLMVAFGSKEILRIILTDLRDTIEDEADENNFVNI